MEDFLLGIMLGFGVAIPIGPLNILIMNYSLLSFRFGFILGLGAMSADLLYFILLSVGILTFLNNPIILKFLAVFGSIFLLYIAYSCFKSINKMSNTNIEINTEKKLINYYIKGFLLNSINPFIISFWISLSSVVLYAENTIFSVFGLFISILLWIFSISFITSKIKKIMNQKIANIFAYISAFLMIIFALILIYNAFFKEIEVLA